MKNLILSISILFTCLACSQKQAINQGNGDKALLESLTASRVTLPNGWSLTPVGTSLNLNDLPLNLVVSPSQKLLAVTNNGQSTQSIMLIDAVSERFWMKLLSKNRGSVWLSVKMKNLFMPRGETII